jgi:dihydrofolate reductase
MTKVKVILYNAITADGYIARKNNDTPWSKEEWLAFHGTVLKIGNIVVGRKTHEIMKRERVFEKCGNPVVVVVNRSRDYCGKGIIVVKSPKDAVEVLSAMKFRYLLLGGGGILNSSFLTSGLVDQLWIDIEPLLFGDGIKIFAAKGFAAKLELIGLKKLSKDLVQIRYHIKK